MMMTRYEQHSLSSCVLVVMMLFYLQLVVCQLPSTQSTTMNKLHQLLSNTSAAPQSPPWNLTKDPCSWKGVTCSNNSSITQISLPSLSISSSEFLSLLCQIDSLQSIDLPNNHFTSIPDEFITSCGKLSGLKNLNLTRNKLFGPLPNLQGLFTKLEALDLSHNFLSQTIHLQLDGLTALKKLSLAYNQFIGPVPTNYGKAMVLQELHLSVNNFSGEIPPQIAEYTNLFVIDLSANNLTGSIPDTFGALPRLQTLVLSANKLSGVIPQFLSNIRSLSRFSAYQNRFTGTIPPGITTFLKSIDLSYNKLNGQIPRDLLSRPNLETVDLSYNLLDGPIPANLSPNLVRLRLGSNKLYGKIPSSVFGSLQKLTYLELDNNTLNGSIPSELGLCKNLQLLNLASNNLSGALPEQLGDLGKLHELKLQLNNLVGTIPVQITQLATLEKLNISCNSLTGPIPTSISKLQNLTNLDLRENNLTGTLPASVGDWKSLVELQLGKNRLEGEIPPLPQSLQTALNLSSNLFRGRIPETFSRLIGLEVLDLSNNGFNGKIPDSLTKLAALTLLVLSNNSLSGEIPEFPKFVIVVTKGNENLRNMSRTPNSPPTRPKRAESVSVKVIVAVAASALAMGVIVVVIALSITRRLHRINSQRIGSQEESAEPSKAIQEANFLTANSIHRSNIDFPEAMEAVTLLSNIALKTRFSTYYKAMMPSGRSYFVKKLNWSDKIFQLGSHENFVKELQILGNLSNSNVMTPLAYFLTVDSAYLVYELAPKGTLYNVLHSSSKAGEASSLDWASRYSIAIGIAQGLAFLHGFHSGPLLLLDLTSKTIMLRSLKEPQIGDIELYKVIDPSKSTSSFSTIAGSVGYIPPEYAYTMRVTTAGNVYSFGVILLELLTGKPAVSQQGIEFAKWVVSNSVKQATMDHILDYSVSRTSVAVRNQMLAVLKIALSCVSVSPAARPKTKSILRMLLNAR